MKKTKKQKNENGQIPLSLTTVSTCKNEFKIWIVVSYIMIIEKWYSTNKSKNKYEKILTIKIFDSINK